jgi:hypothetical protein
LPGAYLASGLAGGSLRLALRHVFQIALIVDHLAQPLASVSERSIAQVVP